MEYLYTARFLRSFRKLSPAVQDDCYRTVALFKNKKNEGEIKLHKLHGKLKKYHAFSVNFAYRIIIKLHKKKVYFMDVGSHTLYA
ncbi:MAG: hypothetical protein Q7S11_01875 [bacterium]|nr:hypothetical protein [bacterium]